MRPIRVGLNYLRGGANSLEGWGLARQDELQGIHKVWENEVDSSQILSQQP
jgi:hypothetical protein